MNPFIRVVFPLPLDQSFIYGVPERLRDRVRPGCRVLAPLGRKNKSAFVVAAGPDPPPPGIRVKEIIEILDERPFWDARFLSFTQALSAEFRSSWGELLQASLPPSLALKTKVTVTLTDAGRAALERKKLGPKELALASLLRDHPAGRSPVFLQRKAGLTKASPLISRMEKKGLLLVREAAARPPKAAKDVSGGRSLQLRLDFAGSRSSPGPLSPAAKAIEDGRFGAFLLFGARSVLEAAYRELIRTALGVSGRTLFLVPEVALTGDFMAGLETQFGRAAAVFHGRMTGKQKETAWRGLLGRKTALVAGTRSALLLETRPLRLVVVDGEHEESYVQTESPAYDARRGAFLRARVENAVVVFGSPRPTVEAFYEAGQSGSLIELDGQAGQVPVTWVDKRAEGPVLSPELAARVQARLK
jgi:primosomal protein N' (replication factor Y)